MIWSLLISEFRLRKILDVLNNKRKSPFRLWMDLFFLFVNLSLKRFFLRKSFVDFRENYWWPWKREIPYMWGVDVFDNWYFNENVLSEVSYTVNCWLLFEVLPHQEGVREVNASMLRQGTDIGVTVNMIRSRWQKCWMEEKK